MIYHHKEFSEQVVNVSNVALISKNQIDGNCYQYAIDFIFGQDPDEGFIRCRFQDKDKRDNTFILIVEGLKQEHQACVIGKWSI